MADDLKKSAAEEASELLAPGGYARHLRFVMALLGAIPWVGSFIAAGVALHAEREQGAVNLILQKWLEEHENKFRLLEDSVRRVTTRVDEVGPQAQQRLNDEAFLPLVRRAFQGWDRAQTAEKRRLFERLIENAAGSGISDEDRVRLFIDWIDRYDDVHFRVIAAVFQSPGISRHGIWKVMAPPGPLPRENSSEADLFRMVIHDLSTGRVIRQRRPTTADGRFLRESTRGPKPQPSPYLKSSFDADEPYELSELGQNFVHYVLTDAVRGIEERAP